MKQKKCPICRKPVKLQGNPNRPFCSVRCREIDLSNWVDESYIIPGQGLGGSDDVDSGYDERDR